MLPKRPDAAGLVLGDAPLSLDKTILHEALKKNGEAGAAAISDGLSAGGLPGERASRVSGARRVSFDHSIPEERMNTNRYQKRIKLKYWLLSFFYDFVEIFFYFNTETNPRHGLARLIPNDDLQILDVCFGTGNSTLLVAKNNIRNTITSY